MSIDAIADHATAVDLKRAKRKRTPAIDPARLDRLPPHSTEAEQGVLGCILWSPQDCLNECIAKFKTGEEVFYDLRHQAIYDAMVGLSEKLVNIDLITLQQALKDKGLLDQIGGIAYLSSLADCVPSAANLEYYVEIVWEKFRLRKMLRTCTDISGRILGDEPVDVDQFCDEAEHDFLAVAAMADTKALPTAKDLVAVGIAKIEQLHQHPDSMTGITTGLLDLDNITKGLQPGDMIVIAARPSVGKTSLAMNIAEHVACDANLPVGVFSLEMTAESLMLRMLCARARVNIRDVDKGLLTEQSFIKLTTAAAKLSKAPLYVDDSAGLSIMQLRAKARRMHQQYGIRLLVIDYLQLLHSTSRKAADSRQIEVSEISAGVKALAKELGIPVVVLCQLNREVEKRGPGSKPRLSELRESGSVEQDADIVGLLYKPASEEEDSGGDTIPVNLLVAKQRNGPTGELHFTFLKGITRFEAAAKVSDEDVPTHTQGEF
jgi:replicative DNA helicase